MKLTIFHFIILSSLLISCDAENEAEIQTEVPGPVIEMIDYPLATGNSWKYKMESEVAEGPAAFYKEYIVDFNVVDDTTIQGVPVKKVKTTETEGSVSGNDRLGYKYLALTNWGLEVLAYAGTGSQVFFKLGEYSQHILFKQEETALSITVRDTALKYMKLPVIDEDSWVSHEFGGYASGANFKRKWSGYYTVSTEAGSFDCIRLDLFADTDNDGQPEPDNLYVVQYISPQYGLVKETHEAVLHFGSGETAIHRREARLIQTNF